MTRTLHRCGLIPIKCCLPARLGRLAHFVWWLARAPTTTSVEEGCCGEAIAGPTADWEFLRLAAPAFHRYQTPMGLYLRRLKAKFGPAAAIAATAHKIAITFRTMVSKQEYDVSLLAKPEMRERRIEAGLQIQRNLPAA